MSSGPWAGADAEREGVDLPRTLAKIFFPV
jgi:hypothetical protein